ncbi:MAG: hypothetical protein L6R41_001092 [Letrouitia leprolyta]|nr:MAG: hypothetical protein L6R41_001092 [Letrouitia leprolyta]
MILILLYLSLILSPLVLALPLEAGTPGDPNLLDFYGPKDSEIHHGISHSLLDTFKLVSQYAAAAYCPDNNDSPDTILTCPTKNCPLVEAAGVATLSEFEDTPKFDDTGYIAIDDTNKIVVLAIRGSVSKQNWRADWDMIRVKINFCHDCHVHRGFKHSWEEVKDAVMSNMKKAVALHPDYRIIITGHSLGGAIATLAAAEIRRIDDHFLTATELYTFGSPRLANQEAARWLSGQSRLSWRITNENDIVPRLPPRLTGYHHVLPEYWIPRNGDNPDNREIEWASREDSSWGNEGQIIPKRSSHSHYFGMTGACSGDSGDRIGGLIRDGRVANITTMDDW